MNQLHVFLTEFLEKFVEFGKRLGHDVGVAVRILGIVDFFDRHPVPVQIMRLERIPDGLVHLEQHAKARRFLPAAVAEPLANFLILLGRHRFEQRQLLAHQFLGDVHAAKKR